MRKSMRTTYHEELSELGEQLAVMCGLAGTAMARASDALLQGDLTAAEDVISGQAAIEGIGARVEEMGFKLLALQQPVAGELRSIIGALHVAADVDRMGALAVHIAKLARRRHPHRVLPDNLNPVFAEMGRVAVKLANLAEEVLRTHDPHKAAAIRTQDDAMDDLHRQLFTVVMDPAWSQGAAVAVDVALLGRFYERFADHAVEIGRRVVFEATGVLPSETKVGN